MLKALSLFANVGIAEAYFKEIGIDVVIANEIDVKRANFYKHIYPKTNMIIGDITNDIVRTNIVEESIKNNIEFIIATPPCQGMSIAGKMEDLDERNQLIFYAVDIIKRLNPKYVLFENVPRQLYTKIKYNKEILLIPDYIKKELSNYNFNNETLIKAMDYGVPQIRQRNILLLTRKGLKVNWTFPQKENPIPLKVALKDVPSLYPVLREGIKETIEMFPDFEDKRIVAEKISKWHFPPKHNKKQVEWMLHTPSGCTAFDNKIFYPQKAGGKKINGHYNHYRRNSWDSPARTITQNNGVVSSLTCVHPGHKIYDDGSEKGRYYSDPRVFTIYELLIITSLPLDWNIPDWAEETFIRNVIGEGIPSLLVKKIMLELLKQI
jgi:DNA (cytosine-5)-methyltransferase 1